jgi:beta-glucosidase
MKKLIIGAAAAFAVVTAGALPSFIFVDAASASTAPSVTSVTPATGTSAGATPVTIAGTFASLADAATTTTTVAFGGHAATSVHEVSATSITAVAPAGFGTVQVRVTQTDTTPSSAIDGTSALNAPGDNYTYTGAGGPGPIVGYASRCVDDWLSRITAFNKIDIYSCNGTKAQQWLIATGVATHAGGTISLANLGGGTHCMDVRLSGGANGTLINLYPCNGTGAQLWSAYAHNQLRNPESGKCLTDKGYATNGAQLILSTCKGNPNQRWLLP